MAAYAAHQPRARSGQVLGPSSSQVLSAETFHKKAPTQIPGVLRAALGPLVETIASLTARIKEYDLELEAMVVPG